MSAPKLNFFQAHWDWLVALVGVGALAAALVFLVMSLGVSPEDGAQAYEAELKGVKALHDGVEVADLSILERASKVAQKPPALQAVDPQKANFLASESRVFCQKGNPEDKGEACGKPIPAMSEVCPLCGVKQHVVKVEADTDHDGLPNDWEKKYGLNQNDANDAMVDTDKDGFNNFEEYEAETDPTDKESHPDYLNFLAIAGKVQNTELDFYFKDVQKIPSGYRFTFQRLKRDKNAAATFSATMNGEIETTEIDAKKRDKSGWKVIGFEQKQESRKIPGSSLSKNVDASTVEIQRLEDGRKVKLTIVPNPKTFRDRVKTALESRIDVTWSRGQGKTFTVSEGATFELHGRKYRVSKFKTSEPCELTIVDLLTKKEKIIR